VTPEEKTKLEGELREKYILIPKNKLYYLIGGAVAVVIVASGISLASVFAYLHSEPAEIARKRIEQIRTEAEGHLQRLQQEDDYVRYGSSVALRSSTDTARVLHNHTKAAGTPMGGTIVNAQPLNPSQTGAHWTIEQVNPHR
jgi:hypothetical protein